MKQFGRIIVMMGLAVALIGLPAAAHAQPSAKPAAPAAPAMDSMAIVEQYVTVDDDAGIQTHCRVKPRYPNIGLTIRRHKSTSSDRIGKIYGDTTLRAMCYSESGGSYRCTSSSSSRSWWIDVYYAGQWTNRWVAGACAHWWYA